MESDIVELFEEKSEEGFFDEYKNKNILVITFDAASIEPEHFYIDVEIENYLKIHPTIQQICEKKIDNYKINFIRKYFDTCYLLLLWDLDKDISVFNKTMEIENFDEGLFIPAGKKSDDQVQADKEFNQLISSSRIIIPEPSSWTDGMYDDGGNFEDLVLMDGKYISLHKVLEYKDFQKTNDLLDFSSEKYGSLSYEGGYEINGVCDIRFYLKDSNQDPIICSVENTVRIKFKNFLKNMNTLQKLYL